MVKVTKRAPSAAMGADPDDEVFQQRALELKDEANALYGEHKLKQALEVYEQALSLLEEGDATRAMIHSNRAACYSKMGAYADVVSEASQSLRVDAKSHKAYWHRAQAYLHLGQVAKAKKDLQNVLALDGSHTEAQETLDSLNGVQKPSAPAGLGGMNLKPSSKKSAAGGDKKKAASSTEGVSAAGQAAASAAQTYKEQPSAIQIKAVYGDDIRMFSVYAHIGFTDLVASISTKFATTAQFSIKYEDEEGVMRNLQSRTDFQKSIYATSTRLKALEKPPIMPYVKLFVQDLPKIEEINLVDDDGNPTGLAPNEVVEIDEWILDFSSLFREHLGIDAEGHLDLHQEGMNLSTDLTNVNLSEEETTTTRDAAIAKFQEAAAVTIFNWGNVHMCEGRMMMDGGREKPLEEGGQQGAAIAVADKFDEVEALFDLAKTRFEKALSIKPDHHDSIIALAQRRYERSRLLSAAAGLSGDNGKAPAGHDAKKRTAEAEEEFTGAAADYKAALANLPEEVPKEKTEEEKAQYQALVDEAVARGEEPPPEDDTTTKSQVCVMLGNTLFEHSQLLARIGKAWQPMLDEALKYFHDAGCAQTDIENAIKMHKGKRMEAAK